MVKLRLIILLSILLFLLSVKAGGQNKVEFLATAPQVVELGEYFRLTYTLNRKGDGFVGPGMPNFNASGPMLSTNMSTQFINGKVSQSTIYTYTYTVQSQKQGTFTIPPAKVKVDGKSYSSNPLSIEVLKGNPARQAQQNQANRTQNTATNQEISADDLFVRVSLDKTTVFKGEQILATIKVYTRVNLSRFGDIKLPSFKGFWTQEIKIPEQISLIRENYKGRIYNVGTIKKSILIPQQIGEIRIEAFQLECFINVQSKSRSIFDDFFGSYQTTKKMLTSQGIVVNVKDLPSGAPANFSGAVGQFTLNSSVNKTALEANEALNYQLKIKGKGNFMLINTPEIVFPPDFEVYDPKQTNNYSTTENGISGDKSFEILAIPRFGGTFTIPKSVFSYFDPVNRSYKTLSTPEYIIEVEKGTGSESSQMITRSSGTEIRMLGQDIRYIKTGIIRLTAPGALFNKTSWFYILFIIISLSMFIAIIGLLNWQKKRADTLGLRSKMAGKQSQKRLKKAKDSLKKNNKEEFLDEILKAIWGYLGDKLGIDPSGYRRELIESYFLDNSLEPEVKNMVFNLLDQCEYIRYAPDGQTDELDTILSDSEKLLNQLDSHRGKRSKK